MTESKTSSSIYRLPWLDASGSYSIQDIQISTFQEPDKLRGLKGEIVVNPRISQNSVVGEEPIGRWIRDGGKMIPADFVTLQAATIYAHLERLAAIDEATGVAPLLAGVSRVGLLAQISENSSAPMILNNALYDGRLDALFIVPYSGQRLTISLNGGIIGHEHFHRIYQAIVLNRIREKTRNATTPFGPDEVPCMGGARLSPSLVPENDDDDEPTIEIDGVNRFETVASDLVPLKVLNQTLIRGVNEGFADFWGWSYARDDEFVDRSLGAVEGAKRRLDKPAVSMPLKTVFRNSLVTIDRRGSPILKSENGRTGAAYQLGTEYARVLRGLVDVLVQNGVDRETAIANVRLAMAHSLDDLSKDIAEAWSRAEMDPELMLKPLLSKLLKMSPTGPAVLASAAAAGVCKELLRLKASEDLRLGLCGVELTPSAAKQTGSRR